MEVFANRGAEGNHLVASRDRPAVLLDVALRVAPSSIERNYSFWLLR